MRKRVKKIVTHPLISGSSIVFIGSLIVNIFNYVFNLTMGRLLSIEEYGLLASLTAFISIIAIFQTSLIQLFAKFSAAYTAQDNVQLKKALFKNGLKISLGIGLSFFVLLIISIYPFSKFLHVNSYLILVLVFLSSAILIFNSLPLGILQGELRFISVSALNIIGVVCRILFGVSLVLLGFGVMGGIIGTLISFSILYVVSFFFNKNYKHVKGSDSHVDFFKEFKKISLPFLLASLGVIIIQSTDVILARHFLNQTDAGRYAALSLMGKAIFYITSPLFFAFFPLIAQKKERNEKTFSTLLLGLSIVFLCSLFFFLLYSIYPSTIISFFFPQSGYQKLTSFMGAYSLYILIFSLAFLIHNYYLSLGKTGVYKPSLFSAGVYFILIFFFHQSIQQFINVLIISSLLLLVLLLVYYKNINYKKLWPE